VDVYSKRLISGRNITSASETVPSGFVWVVRCIDVFFGGGVVGGTWDVTGDAGQTFAWGSVTALLASLQSWRGRQVLEAGVTLGFTSGPGLDVTISGYQLSA